MRVGARAEAILSQFWRDDEADPAIRALELEGWIDVLEGCGDAEIRYAWSEYQKDGPRSRAGRLLRPDAGAIYRLIMAARGRDMLAARAALPRPPPEPDRASVSPDAAREIMRRAGLVIGEDGRLTGLGERK